MSQVEEISAHANTCVISSHQMERIKQNTLLHDAKLEECKKELQEIGKLNEVNPNYELKFSKPGAKRNEVRKGLEISTVGIKSSAPAVEFKMQTTRSARTNSTEI